MQHRNGHELPHVGIDPNPKGLLFDMLEIRENNGKFLAVRAYGKIDRPDYDRILPMVEKAISAHAPIRMLVEVDDFRGWSPSALAEQIKFDLRHRTDFERVAVLGGGKFTRLLTRAARPFLTAEMRTFDDGDATEARAWVTDGVEMVDPTSEASASDGGSESDKPLDVLDVVDEASEESFPASDPPGYTPSRL